MPDLQPVRDKTIFLPDSARNLSRDNLPRGTERLPARCIDADTIFVRVDAAADAHPFSAKDEVPWREAVAEIVRLTGEAV